MQKYFWAPPYWSTYGNGVFGELVVDVVGSTAVSKLYVGKPVVRFAAVRRDVVDEDIVEFYVYDKN